ncbi:hypothetical protein FHR32_005911 [Streptosporangium album]|uniref:Carrier domain-containing protein n=1 Tax=Streptosporangium album TaxID=47479 RepID=A0A7W7WCR2_9ACTN|nr:condensation domain-containing protein [Streptosporangium album]MBB4941534.1 hypothetical protein [Streptosporangium album]
MRALGAVPYSFWVLEHLAGTSGVSNLAVAFRTREPLRSFPLRNAVNRLLKRHPALRLRFPEVDGAPVRHLTAPQDAQITLVNGQTTEETLVADLQAFLDGPFDLARDLLFRAAHFTLPDGAGSVVCLVGHHIVIDATSMQFLVEELGGFYDAQTGQDPLPAALVGGGRADEAGTGQAAHRSAHHRQHRVDQCLPAGPARSRRRSRAGGRGAGLHQDGRDARPRRVRREHADASVEAVLVARGHGTGDWRVPLFRHMFNYRPWTDKQVRIRGAVPEYVEDLFDRGRLDLQCIAVQEPDRLTVRVWHSTEVHDEAEIAAFVARMTSLLRQAAEDADRPQRELEAFSPADRELLGRLNDTGRRWSGPPTLPERVAAHRGTAVRDGDRVVTYDELLASAAAVKAAAVIVHDDRMTAFVPPTHLPDEEAGAAAREELWRYARSRLPDYAVPSGIVLVERLPTTANGKIDYRGLAVPEDDLAPESVAVPGPELAGGVLRLWREALGRPGPGEHDNFFLNGGHSVLAVRLIAPLEELAGRPVTVRAVFDHPIPAELAAFLTEAGETAEGADR